jgi:hypothetical protein
MPSKIMKIKMFAIFDKAKSSTENIKSLNLAATALVVRVLGYRSGSPGSIPGTTRKKISGSGTRPTQPRDYN